MSDSSVNRALGQVEIPARQFQDRMYLMGQSTTGSLLSRLALMHQAAKAYALESLPPSASATADVSIEELTDPPFYDQVPDDALVLIQFSYQSV